MCRMTRNACSWRRVSKSNSAAATCSSTTRAPPSSCDLKDLDGLDAKDFQRIYAVNVIGAFQMTRAFAPLLKKSPGAGVVNVSSIASQLATGSSIAYIASKGALNA